MQKKGRGNAKHELMTLQTEIPKLGKLSRSPSYGGYCIKYKQWWVIVKLLYQILATGHGDVDIGGQ